MKKAIYSFLLMALPFVGYSQKLYGILNLTAPFSGISYTNGHNRDEFGSSIPRINGSWGVDIIFKHKKTSHKFSIEQVPFEKYFKLTNKFIVPPNQGLGFSIHKYGTAIDHFIFSYALQKEGKREKGFLFHSSIRFNYSAGIGVSLNRSKAFYKEIYPNSSGGWASNVTYSAYEAIHHRKGFGLFLRSTGGFDFINKRKNNRWLRINLFYDQGLKDMVHFDIHYIYGYFNDPSRQVDVPKQVLKSRGTTFGLSIGVPIKILK